MEKIWIVESRYLNWDQDDDNPVFARCETFVHLTEEGARKRFEEEKVKLELWGMDEEDYETYFVTDSQIALEYSYRANELIVYPDYLYD